MDQSTLQVVHTVIASLTFFASFVIGTKLVELKGKPRAGVREQNEEE